MLTRTREMLPSSLKILALVAIIPLTPLVVPNRYYLYLCVIGAVYLIATGGLNVLVGRTGLISLGTAAFMMIGAYAVAILNAEFGLSLPLGVAVAVLISGVFGLITGYPVLKLGPFAVAAVSLSYILVATSAILYFSSHTGGGDGIALAAASPGLESLWYITSSLAVVSVVLFGNLIHSPLGRQMLLSRLSAPLAEALGTSVAQVRLIAFVIASAAAGLAGGLLIVVSGRTSPDRFDLALSVLILLMVILGGEGSVYGPLFGVAILTYLPVMLDDIFGSDGGQSASLLYGVILLLTVLVIPTGLAGLSRLITARRPATGAVSAMLEHAEEDDHAVIAAVPSSESMSLDVEDVKVSLGGVQALAGANLNVAPGTVHGLIGPNGSGKTTLLNCVSGLLRPDEGHIRLNGAPLRGTPAVRFRRGIARTFQLPQLVEEDSVLDNITYGLDGIRGASPLAYVLRTPKARKEIHNRRRRAAALLRELSLLEYAHEPASSMPAGSRRLIEIVRALASQPKLLLLDEPGAGLNDLERAELVSVIQKINQAGVTVVIVDHHVEMIMAVCDEITVLDRGKVLASGTPDEIRDNREVIDAYFGEGFELV